jgi:hypothetical protein
MTALAMDTLYRSEMEYAQKHDRTITALNLAITVLHVAAICGWNKLLTGNFAGLLDFAKELVGETIEETLKEQFAAGLFTDALKPLVQDLGFAWDDRWADQAGEMLVGMRSQVTNLRQSVARFQQAKMLRTKASALGVDGVFAYLQNLDTQTPTPAILAEQQDVKDAQSECRWTLFNGELFGSTVIEGQTEARDAFYQTLAEILWEQQELTRNPTQEYTTEDLASLYDRANLEIRVMKQQFLRTDPKLVFEHFQKGVIEYFETHKDAAWGIFHHYLQRIFATIDFSNPRSIPLWQDFMSDPQVRAEFKAAGMDIDTYQIEAANPEVARMNVLQVFSQNNIIHILDGKSDENDESDENDFEFGMKIVDFKPSMKIVDIEPRSISPEGGKSDENDENDFEFGMKIVDLFSDERSKTLKLWGNRIFDLEIKRGFISYNQEDSSYFKFLKAEFIDNVFRLRREASRIASCKLDSNYEIFAESVIKSSGMDFDRTYGFIRGVPHELHDLLSIFEGIRRRFKKDIIFSEDYGGVIKSAYERQHDGEYSSAILINGKTSEIYEDKEYKFEIKSSRQIAGFSSNLVQSIGYNLVNEFIDLLFFPGIRFPVNHEHGGHLDLKAYRRDNVLLLNIMEATSWSETTMKKYDFFMKNFLIDVDGNMNFKVLAEKEIRANGKPLFSSKEIAFLEEIHQEFMKYWKRSPPTSYGTTFNSQREFIDKLLMRSSSYQLMDLIALMKTQGGIIAQSLGLKPKTHLEYLYLLMKNNPIKLNIYFNDILGIDSNKISIENGRLVFYDVNPRGTWMRHNNLFDYWNVKYASQLQSINKKLEGVDFDEDWNVISSILHQELHQDFVNFMEKWIKQIMIDYNIGWNKLSLGYFDNLPFSYFSSPTRRSNFY